MVSKNLINPSGDFINANFDVLLILVLSLLTVSLDTLTLLVLNAEFNISFSPLLSNSLCTGFFISLVTIDDLIEALTKFCSIIFSVFDSVSILVISSKDCVAGLMSLGSSFSSLTISGALSRGLFKFILSPISGSIPEMRRGLGGATTRGLLSMKSRLKSSSISTVGYLLSWFLLKGSGVMSSNKDDSDCSANLN